MSKLRVFTAFSGYDSQCMALDLLGIDYELVGWCDIDPNAIKGHNAVYPQWADRNYGDISKIDWHSVPNFDLFTYSSPCQDFSFAGLQQGGVEGSGTRSSLLWECRKAIEIKKPKFLLLENVKALVSDKFYKTYQRWDNLLMRLGYRTFSEVLNAKHYGVPQNRERVFNVSILEGSDDSVYYGFPSRFPLRKRLFDVMDTDVSESYYLKGSKVRSLTDWDYDVLCRILLNSLDRSLFFGVIGKPDVVGCLSQSFESSGRVHTGDGCSPTVTTMGGGGLEPKVVIVNRHMPSGFVGDAGVVSSGSHNAGAVSSVLEAVSVESDGKIEVVTNCLPSKHGCGNVLDDSGISSTVMYGGGGVAFVADSTPLEPLILSPLRTEEGKERRRNGEYEFFSRFSRLSPREDGVANTLTTVSKDNYVFSPFYLGSYCGSAVELCLVEDFKDELVLAARFGEQECYHLFWVRVRKLTERECFRLMGVRSANVEKLMRSGVSKTRLYGLAGNSIVVDVLMYIFAELFHYNQLRGEFIFDKEVWEGSRDIGD